MDVRAHHLLCMRSFQGKGYSKEFVENFSDVINKIKNENPVIRAVNKPDVVCSVCPHNDNGCVKKGPDSEAKVREKDDKVIRLLKIRIDSSFKANKLSQLVNKEIGKKEMVGLCRDCEWLEYCA